MGVLTHSTAYQFIDAPIDRTLRRRVQDLCTEEGLLGTVTLAPEGINISLAGSSQGMNRLQQMLHEHSAYTTLNFHHSPVDCPPYSKLVVQERRSLLSVILKAPVHQRQPAPHLSPEQLCQWLDEKRPVHLLDARNLYEVNLGHFRGAHSLPIQQFRDFPKHADTFKPEPIPVVTYCTGGIRCEIAGSWLQEQGHQEVWQLSGGILNYFTRCGGRHWQGECFVFDDRLAVDPQLRATYPSLCRRCQKPIVEMRREFCEQCPGGSLGTD